MMYKALLAAALVSAAAVPTAANAIAVASSPVVDGTIGANEYLGAITTNIPYDPNAQGDFSSVGNSSNTVAYTVYYTSDANNVYVALQSASPSGLLFSNLYFDTNSLTALGSDIGFEVTNNDAFVPATGVKSAFTLTDLGGHYAAVAGVNPSSSPFAADAASTASNDVIEVSIPWSVFTTDAAGLGQPLVAPGGPLVLRTSQSFGYIAVGGDATTYHTTRFGTQFAPLAAAVPEPATWAMMIGGFGLVGAAARRRRTTTSVSFA